MNNWTKYLNYYILPDITASVSLYIAVMLDVSTNTTVSASLSSDVAFDVSVSLPLFSLFFLASYFNLSNLYYILFHLMFSGRWLVLHTLEEEVTTSSIVLRIVLASGVLVVIPLNLDTFSWLLLLFPLDSNSLLSCSLM